MLNKSDFQIQSEETPLFELVIDVLDSQGKPTGKRKSFTSDYGSEIYKLWMRYRGGLSKRKKSAATTKEDAEKILKNMYTDNKKKNDGNT